MKTKIKNLFAITDWVHSPRSFRARIFWSLIPIITILVILLGVIDFRQQRQLAEDQFLKRGHTMATNLAEGSKLATYTENQFLLESAVKSVTGDADSAYVLIYGEGWKVLVSPDKHITDVTGPIQNLSDAAKNELVSQRPVVLRNIKGKKGRFVEFLVPIVAEETNTPPELQIGEQEGLLIDNGRPQQRTIGAVRLGLSLKNVDAHLATLVKWRGGLLLVFLLLSTLAIYVFSRRITRPIKQLTDQATQIAKGNLDRRIPADSQDEIGQLAASFNNMTQALKGNIDEKELALAQLKDLNQTLEERIRQRTARIEAMNSELQEATRHKSEFLANVNHELRTPVSAIMGFSRLMLRETAGQISELQRDNLKGIFQNAQRLLEMINSLLDLAKIEAGKLEIKSERVQVNALIDEALTMVTPMVRQDHVRLTRDVTADILSLNTDREKLRQIILNLLSNAAKFTDHGEIKISAVRNNGSLRLSVADTGIGIPSEELQHIFEVFHQGNIVNGRNHTGTGLGLAITKKLTTLLGGEITVESDITRGSTFTVTLPVDTEAKGNGNNAI